MKNTLLFSMLIALLILFPALPGAEIVFRSSIVCSAYFENYEPDPEDVVWGGKFSADIFNIWDGWGLGASYFYKDVYYYISYQQLSCAEAHISYLFNPRNINAYKNEKRFLLSAALGFCFKSLDYYDQSNERYEYLSALRPLAFIEADSRNFGMLLKIVLGEDWTPGLECEMKTSGGWGIIFKIGGTLGGKFFGIPSDFYIYSGYELVL